MEKNNLIVRIAGNAGIKDTSELRAYVVSASGNITETAQFDGLEATLKQIGNGEKIYIGSALPDATPLSKASEHTLVNIGAYQVVMSAGNDNVINIVRLPDIVLQRPYFRFCNVTGHLNKNFVIEGQTSNLPICNARVHICNVEKIFLWPIYLQPRFHIPDWLLNELKNKLATANKPNFKVPPIPDPGPMHELGFISQNVALRSLTTKEKSTKALKENNFQKIPDHVLNEIQSATTETIQQTVAKYHEILYPYFCFWPIFWPWFYFLEEETIVYTDCSGHFDAWLFYIGNTVTENIYIWVEVNINGQWVTVYRPPFPCYTKWNYNCGTDINILISDSRVLPCYCDPVPGEVVWISSVYSTSLRNIALNTGQASIFNDARGMAKGYIGGRENQFISPFTSNFPIYVGFGDGMPSGNITHFRWKYHRIADGSNNPVTESFYFEHNSLSKPYIYFAKDMHGDTVPFVGNFKLDELIGGVVNYKIPHLSASVDTGDATSVWSQYLTDTIDINSANAGENLGDGLFEFVLELCDSNGNVQNVEDSIFQVDSLLVSPPNPVALPAGGIDPGYLYHGSDNSNPLDPITGFRFLLRIDNNATACGIDDAIVDNNDGTGSTTDTQCGFASYKNKSDGNMLLKFSAEQIYNYADYSFVVYEGNSGAVESYGGQVSPPVHNTIVNGAPVTFEENPLLSALLGNCVHAAFSENIYVTAYHTNGNIRFYYYDSSKVAAFAIEPV